MNKNQNNNKSFDLEERTAMFGENIIDFVKNIPNNHINIPLIKQVVRSSTSIGANYMEANGSESKKDFIHKIHICKKESKETMHWLRMLAKADQDNNQKYRKIWQEAKELSLIFGKSCRSK